MNYHREKSRRTAPMLPYRATFAHKKVQERINEMHKFRREHEQLRMVIARVLRPSFNVAKKKSPVGDDVTAALGILYNIMTQ